LLKCQIKNLRERLALIKANLRQKQLSQKVVQLQLEKFFVIIDFRKLSNKKHNNFNNNLQIRDQLKTNTSFTLDNIKIDYKVFLKKKKKKLK